MTNELTTPYVANDPRNINEFHEDIPEWARAYITELKEGYRGDFDWFMDERTKGLQSKLVKALKKAELADEIYQSWTGNGLRIQRQLWLARYREVNPDA